jgi:uncharacterized protein
MSFINNILNKAAKAVNTEDKIFTVSIEKLHFDEDYKAVFKQEEDKVQRIAEDMKANGFDKSQPIILDENYAILDGMKAIAQYIDGDDSLLKDNKNDDAEGGWAAIFFMFFFTFALFYLLILSRYRTCPNCGKKRFYATQQTYLYTQKRTDYYRVTYICSHCKHTENKIERRPHQDDDNAGGAILGGTILGSGMRGGGFGGSFGGGSFGGGSFGGGGAGGHF